MVLKIVATMIFALAVIALMLYPTDKALGGGKFGKTRSVGGVWASTLMLMVTMLPRI